MKEFQEGDLVYLPTGIIGTVIGFRPYGLLVLRARIAQVEFETTALADDCELVPAEDEHSEEVGK